MGIREKLAGSGAKLPPETQNSSTGTVDTELGLPTAHAVNVHKLLRQIDLRLVPICAMLYLLCFLCRQNISNAKTYHLADHLNLSPQDYQLALTVFFFTYSLFDVPANIMLKKLRPSVWLPSITLASGVVTIGMGFTKNSGQLIATRVLLGMTECGLFPGVAYVITLWYCKSEAQFREALFFCAASMAGAFAGLLAVPLSKMDGLGGLEGFRWIFIIEGILTVVLASCAYFIVLDTPETAKFLTPSEKAFLLHRLNADEFGEEEDTLTPQEKDEIHAKIPKPEIFKAVLTDWHVYAHILVFYGICAPLYSISLCLPSIVRDLGYTATMSNFLTIPIYVGACIFSLVIAYFADRTGRRYVFLIASFAVMFTGFLIALVRPSSAPGAAYAGVFIAACGIYPGFPAMITWASNNFASSAKRSMAMALHIGFGSFGGAMGPNFYRLKDQPLYRMGHAINVGYVVMGVTAATCIWWSYGVENARREEECERRRQVLEGKLEKAANDQEREALRHAFLVEKEKELAREGDRSVWFRYML